MSAPAPVPAPANPPDPAPPRATSDFGQNLREVIAAALSVAIAAVAIWIIYDVYLGARLKEPNLEAYQRQKDILLLALGLLGTVTGYYLGRVPAERQADAARDAADTARDSERRVKEQVRAGLNNIQQQHNSTLGGAANDPVNTAVNQLRASL